MTELELAQKAARAGGEIVARYFREGVAIRSNQQSYNLVTDADVESEDEIVRLVNEEFPNHVVLGEEAHRGDSQAEHLWVVDPLDGTNNFAHQIPHFSISIAYYRRGQAMCGVVYNPIRGDWFVAARGQGAYYNGQSVQVSADERLDQALIGLGFYYPRGAMMEATLEVIRDLFNEQIHGIRRFASAALDLCQVGAGMMGAFFEYELAPWDFAAGRLFVEEAGGKVTTCRGGELPLAKSSVLATNGRLHAAMLEIVQRHAPG